MKLLEKIKSGRAWQKITLAGVLAAGLLLSCPGTEAARRVTAPQPAPAQQVQQPQYQHKEYPHTIYAQRLIYNDASTGGTNETLYRFYYSEQEYTLYVIMHGSKDGRNFNGISPEEAIEKLCVRNLELLGDKPLDKIVIVCCYPRYHAPTSFNRLSIPIEFISNSPKPLICESYKDHFTWYEAND